MNLILFGPARTRAQRVSYMFLLPMIQVFNKKKRGQQAMEIA